MKAKQSETALLEQWRVALKNAQTQPEIAEQIDKYGYNTTKLAEGQTLYNETKQIWETNKQEDNETAEAYNIFKDKRTTLHALYTTHRRRAKAKFKRNNQALNLLALTGSLPIAYLSWLNTVKQFYQEINKDSNQALKDELLTFNTTQEELTQGTTLIVELETARAEYLREVGESQDATKAKDTAMSNLEIWMQDFYAMANDALIKNPQLLEAIGLFRKS